MSTRKVVGLAAVGLLGSAAAHAAEVPDTYFAIDVFAVQNEERIPERDLGFGATAVEFGFLANPIEGDVDGDQHAFMLDIAQYFTLGGFTPYVFGGVGGMNEEIGPSDGMYAAIEAGVGAMFDLGTSTKARVGVSAMSVHNDDLIAGQDAFIDYRFNLGLLWGLGSAPAAAPAAAAAPRVVDSDGDGLSDAADRCPSQAAPTADGCPAPVARTDADGDGVSDGDDSCPGTLAGLKVDERGCAVQTEQQSVVLKGVTFLPGSTTLTNEAKAVLDPAAAALMGQQDLKVEIGGHTDAQGSDAANQKLSQRRADSVRQYLVSKGVAADRLTAKGYGEAQPVATNDTPAGRAENRRVEFKIVR